ncbi:MAG: M23 family metallopeptidase [Bacteroidales bacterium]|nr:M23 family metallopeptidase [Bacteroidales bacterium]
MLAKITIALYILCCLPALVLSQENNLPANYFSSPVDFKMALSGTFGELRTNHFHSGIDIKTFGGIGKPLRAVADGFVSRIAVTPGGFGKAVYIEHPNGYTSVYAHCNAFSKKMAAWVKAEQYRLESFDVNLFPEKDQFVVKKGEIIAYSGNSGSSMGPHLHFEIRKTAGQIPVNPLLFDFHVKDFIRPKVIGLKIFPANEYSLINGKNEISSPPLAGWGPEYRIKSGDTLSLSGEFYFGLNTYDQLNDSDNKNGVFSIAFYIDSNLVFSQAMDEFNFSESRFVNSLIDYSGFINQQTRYQKTYIQPNNRLSIYDHVEGNGIFSFLDGDFHTLKYVVKDASGNESILTFTIQAVPPQFRNVLANKSDTEEKQIFRWDQDNVFETSDFKLFVPKGALYDTINFSYSRKADAEKGFYAPLHKVHNPGTAIHTNCTLSILPDSLPEIFKSKALIVEVNKTLTPVGGEWFGEYLQAKIRNFGNYSVTIDTIAPEIKPLNISPGKNITDLQSIRMAITDKLSGIASYKAKLNGNWLLMEWDPKNNLLVYWIDEHMQAGINDFYLEVADALGNVSEYQAQLER